MDDFYKRFCPICIEQLLFSFKDLFFILVILRKNIYGIIFKNLGKYLNIFAILFS